jgi:opacity protein-like surface antigen
MVKRLLVLALAVVLATSAAALDFDQKQWYGQGVLALPMGDFGDIANIGFGAGVGISVPSSPELGFRGEISYIHFTTEDLGDIEYKFSMIPVVFLAEYDLDSAYLLGGLGIIWRKSKIEFDEDEFFGGSVSDTDTELGLILGGGLALSPSMNLEARLNIISDSNFLSAHVGFKF